MSLIIAWSMGSPLWWIGSHFLTVAGFGLCAVLISRLFHEHRAAPVTLAWLLAIVLMPYVGVPLYIVFGGRKLRGIVGEKIPVCIAQSDPTPSRSLPTATERVLATAGMPPPRPGNAIEFLADGQLAYERLVSIIESAEHSVRLMTFILGRDATGRAIVELLAKKAAAGVEVRLLLDALGCWRTCGQFVDPLRGAGGHVGVFLPVLPLRRKWSANLRNHRKMVIVDGETAIVGGMNVANEYLGPRPDPQRWLDTGAVIRGPAVADLDQIFRSDWEFATDEQLPSSPTPAAHVDLPEKSGIAEIIASGPDTPRDAIYEAIFTATMEARERIWLVTPYFVPDETLFKALLLQCRLGNDVRILIPGKSNHRLADFARGQYLRELAGAGAKIFAYPRMLHAKLMLFDSKMAMVGSANVDARSFYLNFEAAAMMYSPVEIADVARWMEARMGESGPAPTAPVSFWRESAESLAGLVAPLL